jgi:hypothetical protein
MIGRKKTRKLLRGAAAELLLVANELSIRPRGLEVPAEEARELADRIRRVAGDLAILAYELVEEESEE